MTAIEYVQLHCNDCGVPFPPPDQPPATCTKAELRKRAANAVWEVPVRPNTPQTQNRRSTAGDDVDICPHCQISRIQVALAELESPEVRQEDEDTGVRIRRIAQAHEEADAERFQPGLIPRLWVRLRARRAGDDGEDFVPVPAVEPQPARPAAGDAAGRLDPARDGVPA